MVRGHCLGATSFPDEFTNKKTSVTVSVFSPSRGVKEEEEEMFDEGETLDEDDSRSSGSHASGNSIAVILKRKFDDCLAAESVVLDQSFSKKPRSELTGIDVAMKDVDEEEDTASTSFAENKSQELVNKGKSVAECSNSQEQNDTAKPALHPSWLSARCKQLMSNSDQDEIRGLGSTSYKAFPSNEQRWSKPASNSHCKLHNRDFSDCLLRHLKSPLQPCHCVKGILEDILPHLGK